MLPATTVYKYSWIKFKSSLSHLSWNLQEANANVLLSGTHENFFGLLPTIQTMWVQKGPLAVPAIGSAKVGCKTAAVLSGFVSLKLFPISTSFKKHQENIMGWAGDPALIRKAQKRGLPFSLLCRWCQSQALWGWNEMISRSFLTLPIL